MEEESGKERRQFFGSMDEEVRKEYLKHFPGPPKE
jgi:hypothetical protein